MDFLTKDKAVFFKEDSNRIAHFLQECPLTKLLWWNLVWATCICQMQQSYLYLSNSDAAIVFASVRTATMHLIKLPLANEIFFPGCWARSIIEAHLGLFSHFNFKWNVARYFLIQMLHKASLWKQPVSGVSHSSAGFEHRCDGGNTDVGGWSKCFLANFGHFEHRCDRGSGDVWRLVRKSSQQLFTLVTARVKICGGVSWSPATIRHKLWSTGWGGS